MPKTLAVLALVVVAIPVAVAGAQPLPKAPECVARLDGRGYDFSNVILPPGATDTVRTDLSRTGQVTGKVADLYGQYNTHTDAWYKDRTSDPKDPCPLIIGGPTPTNLPNPAADIQRKTGLTPAQQRQYAANISDRTRSLVDSLPTLAKLLGTIPPIYSGTYKEPTCYRHSSDPRMPPKPTPCGDFLDTASVFRGRDIIFIHGLMPSTLFASVSGNDVKAKTIWPRDRAEFYGNGWWKQHADTGYWRGHIDQYLHRSNRPSHNRYLIVAWPSTQTMEFAAHAALKQIADAMISGTDVRTELMRTADQRGQTGFCVGGCVIVSHSTGGPVTDVSMSLAAKTSAPGPRGGPNPLRALLGDLGFIPNHVAVHVGLAPALSGSGIAASAILAAMFPGDPLFCSVGLSALAILNGGPTPAAFNAAVAAQPGCLAIAPILLSSVLRDLTPVVMRTLWGSFIGSTPVPVLTVTGGTPYDDGAPTKFMMLNGLDDGVVQMESTCGRTDLDATWPVGFLFDMAASPIPNPLLYDLGMSGARAGAYFAEQAMAWQFSVDPKPRAGAACTPYKSPWGMIEAIPPFGPAGSPPFSSAMSIYGNHYTFIQSADNHGWFVKGGPADAEEVRAVLDEAIFARGLVSPRFQSIEEEEVKGKKIGFRLRVLNRTVSYEWWIWKRTYHRLKDWQTKRPSDYVYEFVLRP